MLTLFTKCSYSFYFAFMTSTVTLCFLTEKKTLLQPKRTEWLIAWRYVKTSWHSRWGMQQSMDGHVRLRIIRLGHILWVICKSLLMSRLGRHFSPLECKFSEGIQDEKSSIYYRSPSKVWCECQQFSKSGSFSLNTLKV